MLEIKDLHAGVINTSDELAGADKKAQDTSNYKEILKGISLSVKPGEIHAIMGPNGSGKSSLAYTLAGNPKYIVKGGVASLDSKNLLDMEVEDRAKAGLFLSMQYPTEIPAITLSNFLRTAKNSLSNDPVSPIKLMKSIHKNMDDLKIDSDFLMRPLNVGSSGGEKKKNEILQLEVLKPKVAILDEIDSGLDIDALKVVSQGVNRSNKENGTAIILITHYNRLLEYIKPDYVHIFSDGKIVKTGDIDLANELEAVGYDKILKSV